MNSERFAVAVVGSGAAGIAAAVTCGRLGVSTLLLDARSGPGGTGGFSGLTTLCGCYDEEGRMLLEGFAREFVNSLAESDPIRMGRVWVLPYRPERFRELAANYLACSGNVQCQWNTAVAEVRIADRQIIAVNRWEIAAAIDASGTAEVARAIGLDCMETTSATQAPAVVFPLCNVTRDLSNPAAAAQVLLQLARANFPILNFQSHLDSNCFTVKFSGTPARVPDLIGFLRANIKGFENCVTPLATFSESRRAGRMIRGEYVLSGEDVLLAKKFPNDAVARCAWPIEQWDEEGRVRLRYLPDGDYYQIPAQCLRSTTIRNLFMAGKTISADIDAIASARVMGCCLATGAAAGHLSAQWVQSAVQK